MPQQQAAIIPACGQWSSAAAGTGSLIKKGMCSCDVALQAAIREGESTPSHQPRRPLGGQLYQGVWRCGWSGGRWGRESDISFVLLKLVSSNKSYFTVHASCLRQGRGESIYLNINAGIWCPNMCAFPLTTPPGLWELVCSDKEVRSFVFNPQNGHSAVSHEVTAESELFQSKKRNSHPFRPMPTGSGCQRQSNAFLAGVLSEFIGS